MLNCRLGTLVKFLRENNSSTHIILLPLLPRGSYREGAYDWPTDFSPAITSINSGLSTLAAQDAGFIHYADCMQALLPSGKVCRAQQSILLIA